MTTTMSHKQSRGLLYICIVLAAWVALVCTCRGQTFPQVGSSAPGKGYTIVFVTTANTTPASGTTYFLGTPGTGGNTTYSIGAIDVPKSGTVKRVSYKARLTTLDTTEANGVVHSIRLNNTTDFGASTFAYTQSATNTVSSGLSQAVSAGDTLALKVVTPVSFTVAPFGLQLLVTVYIE